MIRRELHNVRRPLFDCTSVGRSSTEHAPVRNSALHLHAEMIRPLPSQTMRYSDIKVALRLGA